MRLLVVGAVFSITANVSGLVAVGIYSTTAQTTTKAV